MTPEPRPVDTSHIAGWIKRMVKDNPTMSTKQLSAQLHIPPYMIRALKDEAQDGDVHHH